MTNIHTRKTI